MTLLSWNERGKVAVYSVVVDVDVCACFYTEQELGTYTQEIVNLLINNKLL